MRFPKSFFCLLILLAPLFVKGQFTFPDSVQLPHLRYFYPPGIAETGAKLYLYERIHPVGWSPKGKFACLFDEVEDVELGENIFSLVIQDMEQNELLVMFSSGANNMQAFWEENQDTLQALLHLHNIQQKPCRLAPFPIRHSSIPGYPNHWIRATWRLDPKSFEEAKGPPYDLTFRHRDLFLEDEIRGEKKVFSDRQLPWNPTWDHLTHGYFKSPFEERIAIVNTYVHRTTCGGFYSGVEIHLVGAKLDEGFKFNR